MATANKSVAARTSTLIKNRIVGHALVPASQLLANPDNYRTHPKEQREALRGSLEVLGRLKEVLVNTTTGHVIDGHARIEEMLERDPEEQMPVTYVELSLEEERIALAVLDPISAMAVSDDEVLERLLADVRADAQATDERLAAFLEELNPGDPPGGLMAGADPDEAPDLPAAPVTVLGEVIHLGPHRLTCGDATDPACWARVLEGRVADGVWTDPPYGVTYDMNRPASARSTVRPKKLIENDDMNLEGLRGLLKASLGAMAAVTKPGGCFYVAGPHGPPFRAFCEVLGDLGIWRRTLVWVKSNRFVMGRSDYHYRHEAILEGEIPPASDPSNAAEETEASASSEPPANPPVALPVVYGWRPGAAHTWLGGRKLDTVLEFPAPMRSTVHPTMKPVALIEACLRASTVRGALIIDGFSGSGSTLIACEALERVFAGIELDPAYCDVIVHRWQELTGRTAVRIPPAPATD